jgi:hypothetical protein
METQPTMSPRTDGLVKAEVLCMRPWFILLVTSAIIFIAEAFVMLLLNSVLPLAPHWEMWVDAVMLSVLVIPSMFFLVFRPLRQLAVAYRQALAEVKVLQGIVPICSMCKNIRDDKGAWQQVEAYVRSHSEVQFSHGLCPACIQKHYPEDADSIIEQMDAADG